MSPRAGFRPSRSFARSGTPLSAERPRRAAFGRPSWVEAAAFRRALETWLLTLSRDSGVSLVRPRKSVAFDRLVARLFTVAPDRWVLKGGLALDYRLGTKARSGQRCHRGCCSR